MSTITNIQTRIERRFPRIDTEVSTEITSNIYDWLADICSEYPFWFLKVHPGNLFPANFPLDAITDLNALTHMQTDWLDRGWLHVQADQEKYFLAGPAAQGKYDQDDSKWAKVKAQKVYFVKQFDERGNFKVDLPIHMGSQNMSHATWSSTGTPQRVFFESGLDSSDNEVSWLRFNPIPREDMIYAVSFALTSPINYGTPITNRFFQEYPEAAVCAGMMFAAEYFSEARDYQHFHTKLYGDPSGGFATRKLGFVEKMKRDTRKRSEQEDFTFGIYQGMRGSNGRAGAGGRNRYQGTYYGRDGFS
jgi:hypothetical protein